MRNRRNDAFTLAEVCISGAILLVVMIATMGEYSSANKQYGELTQDVEMNYQTVKVVEALTRDVRQATIIVTPDALDATPANPPAFDPSANAELLLETHERNWAEVGNLLLPPEVRKIRWFLDEPRDEGSEGGTAVRSYKLKRGDPDEGADDGKVIAEGVYAFVVYRVKDAPNKIVLRLEMRNLKKDQSGKIEGGYRTKLETVIKTRGLNDTGLGG